MAEDKSEVPNPGRRNVFKIGAVALGAALLVREAKTFHEQKIETDSGIFYPLYEYHMAGIKEEYIPNDLDGFFREYAAKNYFAKPPVEVLYDSIKIEASPINKGATIHTVEFPIIRKLAQNGTKVIFGDSMVSNKQESDEEAEKLRGTRIYIATAIAATESAYIAYKTITHKLQQTKPTQDEITRRNFLAKLGLGATFAVGAPIIKDLLNLAEVSTHDAFDQRNAALRVIQRLETLIGTLVPEDHLIFFRSIVMVDKILTVAEDIQRETGKKPKIAFHVGARHSNMEDMLLAGHDFSRFLLSLYSADFLQGVAEVNGGLENFCSARVLTLNPDVTQEDVENKNNDLVVSYEDRIMDKPLLETLGSKLAG